MSIKLVIKSQIPPMVVARRLDSDLKELMQAALITMHYDPDAAGELHEGRIDHFVAVTDADYDDIRSIYARVQAAEKAWQEPGYLSPAQDAAFHLAREH